MYEPMYHNSVSIAIVLVSLPCVRAFYAAHGQCLPALSYLLMPCRQAHRLYCLPLLWQPCSCSIWAQGMFHACTPACFVSPEILSTCVQAILQHSHDTGSLEAAAPQATPTTAKLCLTAAHHTCPQCVHHTAPQVYVWPYREGPASQPAVVLKTRKSLRALHFHPHGLPILLTAEVVERKSSSNSATGGSVAGVPGQPEPSESAPQPPLPLPPLPTPSAPIDIPGAGLQPQQREPGPSPVTRPPVSQPIAISVGGAGASQRPWVPTASAQPHVGSVGSRPELNITHSSYRLVSLAASPPGSSPPLITRLPPSRFAQASQARSLGTAGTPPGAAHVPAANHGNTSTTTSGWVGPMLQPDGGHQTTQPPLLGHWDRQWMGAPQHIPFAPQPTPTAQPPITGAAPAATGGAPRSVPWPISGQDSQAGAPQQALSAAASAAVPTVPGGPAASALRAQLQASTHPGVAQFNSSTGAGEVGPTFGGQQQQHHHQEQRQAPPPHEQQPPQPSMLMPLPTQSLGSAYAPAWGWEVSPQASLQVMASLRERHTLRLEHQLPLAGSTEGEQPCIVSLTIWPFAESQPGRPLTKPAFNIPRAVLCECGRECLP
jgi:hypothetical protein